MKSFVLALLLPLTAFAQTPKWIWSSTNNTSTQKEVRIFRKHFSSDLPIVNAILSVTGDDKAEVYLNGKRVAGTDDWSKADVRDVTSGILTGSNVLAVRCENAVSYAGVIAKLELTIPTIGSAKQTYNPRQHAGLRWINTIVTDNSWIWSDLELSNWFEPTLDDSAWKPAVVVASLGDKPWGNVFATRDATPASDIKTEPGFKIELLHSATPIEGSWISMAMDRKGRLLISPQGDGKLVRVTISRGHIANIERLDTPVSSAMGMLYFDKTLYVDANGPKGWGIYRLHDRGDDFTLPTLLRNMDNGTEHGSHALVLGPDHKLYVVCGNFNKVPADVAPDSPHRNYADDQLLPRAEDGNGFGAGLQPPGGSVYRMDLDGRNCQLFAGGTRNTYCIAFNPDGELFGFDSDMEWDWGADWYRPIRINLWVSGGDYGFREGSGKFPEYYGDTLPAILNVGIGSPTGVLFPTTAHFPKWYRDSFLMEDWSYGRLFAAHLIPHGASYDATLETIFRGIPLNLTAMQVGADGALYLITGGRNTESGLYRLTYDGPAPHIRPVSASVERDAAESRRIRHELEYFHGKRDPDALGPIWRFLGDNDRWIRYAARIALESQDVDTWKSLALAETDPTRGLTALLALARCGGRETQPALLDALGKFPLDNLNYQDQLLKLRIFEVSFCRQGAPPPSQAAQALAELDPLYPTDDQSINRELCQLLLYLRDPDATAKTISLLDKAPTEEEQVYYMMRLRNITTGWNLDLRKEYLQWFGKDRDRLPHRPGLVQYFTDAGRDYADGSSLPRFLDNFRNEFVATLSTNDRVALAAWLPKESTNTAADTAGLKFVKNWTMQDLEPDLDHVKTGRAFAVGKKAFVQAQCVLCHRFSNTGGSIGPELTAVSSRLTARDILESIILPSKVVSEQYQNTLVTVKDGDDYVGRVVEENDQNLVLMVDPVHLTKVELRKSDIAKRLPSKISPMPEGLVNSMTEDQIWDLIAYLQSGGKKEYAAFHKPH